MWEFERLKKELIEKGYTITPLEKQNVVKVTHESYRHTLALIAYTAIPRASYNPRPKVYQKERLIVIVQSAKVQMQRPFNKVLGDWGKIYGFEASISCSKFPDYIDTMLHCRLNRIRYVSEEVPPNERITEEEENGFIKDPDWIKYGKKVKS